MAPTNASASLAYLASAIGDLLVRPAMNASVAAQVCTIVPTGSATYRIPVLAADPTTQWVAEGDEITPADPTLAEVVVTPKKVAGLTIISRELAEDASPEAATMVGESLARSIAAKIDAAFFANTTTDGPSGLLSLTTSTSVEAASSFSTLDSFAGAIYTAEGLGVNITSFVTSAGEALALSTLKQGTDSIRPLLTADVTTPTARTIYGRPLLVGPTIGVKTAWAVAASRNFLVMRDDARVEVDRSVFFTSDRVAVKATMRIGFGFAQPLGGVVKITHA